MLGQFEALMLTVLIALALAALMVILGPTQIKIDAPQGPGRVETFFATLFNGEYPEKLVQGRDTSSEIERDRTRSDGEWALNLYEQRVV